MNLLMAGTMRITRRTKKHSDFPIMSDEHGFSPFANPTTSQDISSTEGKHVLSNKGACPCIELVSIESIYAVLSSEERSKNLIDWLSGGQSTLCTRKSDCDVAKVSASFNVLNAIRTACKPHLETLVVKGSKSRSKPDAPSNIPETTYEESFPSLSSKPPAGKASTVTSPKVNDANARKNTKKKRIRPVAVVPPTSGTTGVWGNIAKQKPIELPLKVEKVRPETTAGGVWGKGASLAAKHSTDFADQSKNQGKSSTNAPLTIRNENFLEPNHVGNSLSRDDEQFAPNVQGKPSSTAQLTISEPKKVTAWGMVSDNPPKIPNKSKVILDTSTAHTVNENTTPTKQNLGMSTVTPAGTAEVGRCVDIYCSLLLNNLVPSTALEFHFLLKLLNVADRVEEAKHQPTLNEPGDGSIILTPIFFDAALCRSFAAQAISKLSFLLKRFGMTFLQNLVKGAMFRKLLPEVTNELEKDIKEQATSGGLLEHSSILSGGHQTALLSLPFQPERDSRHNYKSSEETQLYKNREESRDAFLYQLRAYLNVRGKILNTIQAKKEMQKIRRSSRNVVDSIMSVNLPWFAQFFCELLLQVGLVPLEETDEELLDIAGKEKLQKLHKRFSAKFDGKDRSRWDLASQNGKRQTNLSLSTVEQAQLHFSGHQEFFYFFMTSADSYKFNFHLRSQIVRQIKKSLYNTDNKSSIHLEKSLLHMQMLAKFLGVLVFSPTWQEFQKYNGSRLLPELVPPDGLNELDSDGDTSLHLVALIREALAEGHLTAVIPWLVELLRMATWDTTLHRRSIVYKKLLKLLRNLQEQLSSRLHRRGIEKGPTNCQLVLFSLESLFGETVGLARAASLKHYSESTLSPNDTEAIGNADVGAESTLDDSPLQFSTATLFSASPHLEDLLSLAETLSRTDRITSTRSPGVSRKLRPVTVSQDNFSPVSIDTSETKLLVKESPMVSPTAPASTVTPKVTMSGSSSPEAKLMDTFFHQHRELKDICEFAVHQILKKMTTMIPEQIVKPTLESETLLACETRSDQMVVKALALFRSKLEEGIDKTLTLFEPHGTNPKVHELAVSLALSRGYEAAVPYVTNLATSDLKPIQRSLFGYIRESGDSKQSSLSEGQKETDEIELQMAKMTEAVKHLSGTIMAELTDEYCTRVSVDIRMVESLLDSWLECSQSKIPSEASLRSYFESVSMLDKCSLPVLDFCFGYSSPGVYSDQRWDLLHSFLGLGLKLSRRPRRGLSRLIKYLQQNRDALDATIQLGLSVGSRIVLAKLLVDMVEGNLICIECLDEALVCSAKNDEAILKLAKECTSQLQKRPTNGFRMPKVEILLKC